MRLVWDRLGRLPVVAEHTDRRVLKRSITLVEAWLREPFEGIGKARATEVRGGGGMVASPSHSRQPGSVVLRRFLHRQRRLPLR